jgi:signal transduction histidine kinase
LNNRCNCNLLPSPAVLAADVHTQVLFSNSLMLGCFKGLEQRRQEVMRKIEEGNKQTLIDELKKVLEQKSNFMSAVSHELRTPLNGIIGERRGWRRKEGGGGDMMHQSVCWQGRILLWWDLLPSGNQQQWMQSELAMYCGWDLHSHPGPQSWPGASGRAGEA